MKIIYSFPLILITFLFLCGCGGGTSGFRSEEGMVWNTQFHITYESPSDLSDSIRHVLDEVGASLSVFDPASLVSKVNSSDSAEVNSDFIRVYEMSRRINGRTGGVFDPTLSPLITAWGFGPGHTPTADTLRIDSLLAITGLDRTRLLGNKLIKERKEIEFNFSAIAKGYGCDCVGEMLKRNGVENYLIEIGGEIAAAGKSQRGGKWRISVDRPVFSKDDIIHDSQTVVAFTDMGMATSGNYRNFHEEGGRRYGHTISPKTGRPVQTDILSATVIAPSAMEADGLATALMAMGTAKAKETAAGLDLPVMLICRDTVWVSPGFKRLTVALD